MKSLQDKHVLVLGLGLSGLSVARWCLRCGAQVTVADTREAPPQLAALRAQLLADPYFKGVPSMQPEAKKTAIFFHAKDDLPEVRREVFKVLERNDFSFYAVIRTMSAVAWRLRQRASAVARAASAFVSSRTRSTRCRLLSMAITAASRSASSLCSLASFTSVAASCRSASISSLISRRRRWCSSWARTTRASRARARRFAATVRSGRASSASTCGSLSKAQARAAR
jgi:hypothetical protein